MRSEEAQGGFLVFRRFTGLLLGRPLRNGHIPFLKSTAGKAFISVKESVRGGFNFATEGNPVRVAAAGKGSSLGDEGPALRFRTSKSD